MQAAHVQNMFDGVIRFVELSSALAKRAIDELTVHRQLQKKAQAAIGPLLDRMVETGAVDKEQKQAAAAMLGQLDTTLELLKEAVDQLHELRHQGQSKAAAQLGSGIDSPRDGASQTYDSLNDAVIGRRTSQKKASDLAIERVLDDPRV